MIRVLQLLAPAREGGLETVVRLLGRAMVPAAGLEAGVLVLNQLAPASHPFIEAARADGTRVREVASGSRRYLAEARAIEGEIRAGGWQVLHTRLSR